jgi:hypothetical protein
MDSAELEATQGENAHNEAPTDGAAKNRGAYGLTRTFARATVGTVALGIDVLSAFTRTSIQRGQQMESSAHKLLERYQNNAKVQTSTAAASRHALAKQASITLDENLKALWHIFVITGGAEQAAAHPAEQIPLTTQGECNDGDSSASAKES